MKVMDLPPNLKAGKNGYLGRGAFVDEGGFWHESQFFQLIHDAIKASRAKLDGKLVDVPTAVKTIRERCKAATESGNKVIFIGNGGSSAIASHLAVDWTKNGGIRAIALNDAPALTCLANDFGFPEVFAKGLEFYAAKGDVVIIVSTSGKSENILRASEQAFKMGLDLFVLSGMNPDNVLRTKGALSIYVPAMDYGIVEIAHLSILHAVVSV